MTAELLARRLALLAAGFVPIPLFGKEPPVFGRNNSRKGFAGWQQAGGTPDQVRMAVRMWPDALNTGCLTRLMPTLDLDILNELAACELEDLVREQFEARGRVLVRIGKPPKRAIPFRTEAPFAKIVANLAAPSGGSEKIEFLGDGQQVAVDGIHPETKRPYRWHGGEPGQVKLAELPAISAGEAGALVERLAQLLEKEWRYTRSARRMRDGAGAEPLDRSADWKVLLDNIHAGRALHDSLRDLAAKLVVAGTSPGAVVNMLRALMESTSAARDVRWAERFNDIPRLVESARRALAS
jgi:hypothetical protein